MKAQDMFLKNQQVSTEFDLYLLDHPEVADEVPNGALVVFLPNLDKDLAKRKPKISCQTKRKRAASSLC